MEISPKDSYQFLPSLIDHCINNAILDIEVQNSYAQIEGERRSNNFCANIAVFASKVFLPTLRNSIPMKKSGRWTNGNWRTAAQTMWTN
jgi:hypothetical protein